MASLQRAPTLPVRFLQPSAAAVRHAVLSQRDDPFSYADVGGTRGAVMPAGYAHDAQDVRLGEGAAVWEAARDALTAWKQFDLPWVHLHDDTVPLEAGRLVAFTSQQLGVWVLNLCRIAYVLDDEVDGVRRFGFAYGTLRSHAVMGEERFLLTWDQRTDEVRFGIAKFSLPRHPLIRALAPLARRVQRRFTDDALARMQRQVREAS